jgi:hypothetical protein
MTLRRLRFTIILIVYDDGSIVICVIPLSRS